MAKTSGTAGRGSEGLGRIRVDNNVPEKGPITAVVWREGRIFVRKYFENLKDAQQWSKEYHKTLPFNNIDIVNG